MTKFTLVKIAKMLRHIDSIKSDPEMAHIRADELYIETLRFIASGKCPDPRVYAKEVLQVLEIKFPRWYA